MLDVRKKKEATRRRRHRHLPSAPRWELGAFAKFKASMSMYSRTACTRKWWRNSNGHKTRKQATKPPTSSVKGASPTLREQRLITRNNMRSFHQRGHTRNTEFAHQFWVGSERSNVRLPPGRTSLKTETNKVTTNSRRTKTYNEIPISQCRRLQHTRRVQHQSRRGRPVRGTHVSGNTKRFNNLSPREDIATLPFTREM